MTNINVQMDIVEKLLKGQNQGIELLAQVASNDVEDKKSKLNAAVLYILYPMVALPVTFSSTKRCHEDEVVIIIFNERFYH